VWCSTFHRRSTSLLPTLQHSRISRIMAATTTNVTGPTDLSSLSNFAAIRTEHIQLDWTIDWTKQLIHGSATLTMKPTKSGIDRVVLDTSYLDISGIKVDGEAVKVRVGRYDDRTSTELMVNL
jgi:aminopeptidase N